MSISFPVRAVLIAVAALALTAALALSTSHMTSNHIAGWRGPAVTSAGIAHSQADPGPNEE